MSEIPRQVLSEAFQTKIAGRQLRAAVFLAFEFDPGFFEQEILPAFFDASLSHVPEIRLLGLAEELRKVDSIAVYYDPRALIAGSQSSHLDIERIRVQRTTGYFHPKVVLALVEDALVVGFLSANLTRSGWWENVEVAHIEEVTSDGPCSFRNDLLALFRKLRRFAARTTEHKALDAIEAFVRSVVQDDQRMRGGRVLPRLFFGDESPIEFLTEVASNRLQRCYLEIISPFFDDSDSLAPIELLRSALRPRGLRIFLPRKSEGDALCSEAYHERVSELAEWSSLPADVMRLGKDSERRLHAKAYRFFDPERRYEAFFVGSANLTNAAFNRGGNVESGVFIETETKRKPDWWLVVDEQPIPGFVKVSEDDTVVEGSGWKLLVRYRWSDQIASCFWDGSQASPSLTLLSHGVEVAQIEPLAPGTWRDLSSAQAAAISEALRSGSFLTVRIEGEPDAQILVEEEQMTHKPSLMARITAADILRYWSLLTPEQKKEFLEEHAEAFSDPEVAMWLGSQQRRGNEDSFFSTFAEVYLSFGALERAVNAALEEGREKVAVERLLGQKFDSLRRLIERVGEEHDSDAVRRYIILLCARQLLDKIERDQPEFATRNRCDIVSLRASLELSSELRTAFVFDESVNRDEFFRWYERWFLERAEPLSEVTE